MPRGERKRRSTRSGSTLKRARQRERERESTGTRQRRGRVGVMSVSAEDALKELDAVGYGGRHLKWDPRHAHGLGRDLRERER